MKKIGYLLFIVVWTNIVFGQEVDSLGINNDPLLNDYEASFLESQLDNKSFGLNDKRIAFYKSLTGIQSKQVFFNDSRKHILNGHKIPLQVIELSTKEKSETGEFDAIVVSWSKFQLTPKMKEKIVEKIKKPVPNN